MGNSSTHEITQLLVAWNQGDQAALDALSSIINQELHRLAKRYMADERQGHLLQPTALVNEAWVRLINIPDVGWQNRSHFVGTVAQLMRRILVDDARRRHAQKYGANPVQVSLTNANRVVHGKSWQLVALDDALNELATFDERRSKIVELRFFGGLSMEEVATSVAIEMQADKLIFVTEIPGIRVRPQEPEGEDNPIDTELPLAAGLALERELQQQLFQSADAKEGISAYVQKRPARFEGK